MSDITNIAVAIPAATVDVNSFFELLECCSNASRLDAGTVLLNSNPEFTPTITIDRKNSSDPFVSLATNTNKEFEKYNVGGLHIGFNLGTPRSQKNRSTVPTIESKSDHVGEYLEVRWSSNTYNQLTFKQLLTRVSNHLVFIDHVGVNINSKLLPRENYDKLENMIAARSYLSNYPTGEEWPFIIPTTASERSSSVSTGQNREPKFELVYDFEYPYPELQIDIQTDLDAKDVVALFPPPYGYCSQLVEEDYCVRCFIYTGWQRTSLRVDLRFKNDHFNLTDWLLKANRRVNSRNS